MMSRTDAIRQLQSLRRQAQDRARLRSRLCIQEYMDANTAADDVAARQDTPIWACALWCVAAAIIGVACVIYAMA